MPTTNLAETYWFTRVPKNLSSLEICFLWFLCLKILHRIELKSINPKILFSLSIYIYIFAIILRFKFRRWNWTEIDDCCIFYILKQGFWRLSAVNAAVRRCWIVKKPLFSENSLNFLVIWALLGIYVFLELSNKI